MPVRVVESKQNARLKELRKALAGTGRGAAKLVGIEGPHLLEEALRARLRVAAVFVAQGSEGLLEAIHLPPEIEILWLPKKLLDAALATETPQPIAALVEPPEWTVGPRARSLQKDAAGRRPRRPSGSRKPGHDPPLGRGIWRNRRGEPSGNGERVEPEGGARVGGERVSRAADDGE